MSTKYFNWDGGAGVQLAGLKYPEGAAVEFVIFEAPRLAVQAWHALSDAQRQLIVTRLNSLGFIEAEQSKPD